jgi:hypothetical protein
MFCQITETAMRAWVQQACNDYSWDDCSVLTSQWYITLDDYFRSDLLQYDARLGTSGIIFDSEAGYAAFVLRYS